MSAKIYAIDEQRIRPNGKKIAIGDKLYTINDDVVNFKKIQEKFKTEDIEGAISLALGEKAYKEITKEGLSMEGLELICINVMAAITGQTVEKFEESFRKAKNNNGTV